MQVFKFLYGFIWGKKLKFVYSKYFVFKFKQITKTFEILILHCNQKENFWNLKILPLASFSSPLTINFWEVHFNRTGGNNVQWDVSTWSLNIFSSKMSFQKNK